MLVRINLFSVLTLALVKVCVYIYIFMRWDIGTFDLELIVQAQFIYAHFSIFVLFFF